MAEHMRPSSHEQAPLENGLDTISPQSLLAQAGESAAAIAHTHLLTLSSGRKFVPNLLGKTTLTQRADGLVYFGSDNSALYDILEISWDGPRYETRAITKTTETQKTKKKRKGRVTGAVVGTLLVPGAGTLIGAGVGTGTKYKTTGESYSETVEKQVEVPAPCKITLENLITGQVGTISVDVTTGKANKLLSLLPDETLSD